MNIVDYFECYRFRLYQFVEDRSIAYLDMTWGNPICFEVTEGLSAFPVTGYRDIPDIVGIDDEGNELLESMEQCIGIEEDISYTSGDMNQDGNLNVLDIVMIVDLILNNPNPSEMEILLGDLTNDGLVNVLDIVALVDTILNP